jgi:DNA relaxase NicK
VVELNPKDDAKVLSDYQSLTEFQRSILNSYYDNIGWDDVPDTYIECCLQFSGQFFALLTLLQQYQYLRKLWYFGFTRCSRIDLKCDDYSFKIIPYADMVRATLAGDVFGFHKYSPVREFNISTGELSGYGDYWGSRESGKYIRNYVHTFDNGTKSLRFEGEFKRGYAQGIYDVLVHFYNGADVPVWDELLEGEYYYTCADKIEYLDSELSEKSLNDFGNLVCYTLFGCLDFRNKSHAKNPSKASVRDTERLPFWQKFLEIIGGRVKVKREPDNDSTLPSAMRWLWRQAGNTIAVLIEGLGLDEFKRLMLLIHEYSVNKLQFKHLEMLELIRKFPNIVNDLGGDMFEF